MFRAVRVLLCLRRTVKQTSDRRLSFPSPMSDMTGATNGVCRPPETQFPMAKGYRVCVVTGASGYVASMLVKMLCEAGHGVRGTVRSLTDKDKVDHLKGLCSFNPPTLYEADLMIPGSFEEVMKGAEVVFHTASPFFTAGYSDAQAELVDPAVQGTENVLNEAIAAGIKRIVLTSSVAAVTDSKNYVPPEDKVFDESDWNDVSTLETNPYSLSKTLAERAAWAIVEAAGDVKMTSINPSFVMGPVLSKRSDATSVGLVKGLMTQASKTAPPACFGVVDVRNVAQAHMEAAFRDASSVSGRYILSSETSYPAIEMADMLREAYPNYPLPTEGSIPVVIHQRSNAKARRELGIDFIHPKKSLKDMAKSMIDFGIIPASNKL